MAKFDLFIFLNFLATLPLDSLEFGLSIILSNLETDRFFNFLLLVLIRLNIGSNKISNKFIENKKAKFILKSSNEYSKRFRKRSN